MEQSAQFGGVSGGVCSGEFWMLTGIESKFPANFLLV